MQEVRAKATTLKPGNLPTSRVQEARPTPGLLISERRSAKGPIFGAGRCAPEKSNEQWLHLALRHDASRSSRTASLLNSNMNNY